jgi:hypothetical protein
MALDLETIEDTPHVLDILLECEDLLDSLDIYVFQNWINGELIDGPRIKRYWVSITLQYAHKQMPDPRAGLRLLKHGILVSFEKGELEAMANKPAEPIWLVKLEVPRRLLSGVNNTASDYYDDEVDQDDLEGAKDMGIDNDTGYTDE